MTDDKMTYSEIFSLCDHSTQSSKKEFAKRKNSFVDVVVNCGRSWLCGLYILCFAWILSLIAIHSDLIHTFDKNSQNSTKTTEIERHRLWTRSKKQQQQRKRYEKDRGSREVAKKWTKKKNREMPTENAFHRVYLMFFLRFFLIGFLFVSVVVWFI